MEWELRNEKDSQKSRYKNLKIILFISIVVYSIVFYTNQRNIQSYKTVLSLKNEEDRVNYTVPDFFKNYSFYGEEKPKLDCWAETGCSDRIIKRDILKRLPDMFRENIRSTLVQTGE